MDAGASLTLPRAAHSATLRTLYFFRGASLGVGGHALSAHAGVVVRSDVDLRLESGDAPTEILVLQGRPIGEPVVQYGPFVMNTRAEIQRAMTDYQRTQFGGWPWPSDGPVHTRDAGRFDQHADGRMERREG